MIDEAIVAKYKREENKKPLKIKDPSVFEGKGYKVIERDLVHEAGDYVRHDPEQLILALEDIIHGWVK
jgi:hypothetical protein